MSLMLVFVNYGHSIQEEKNSLYPMIFGGHRMRPGKITINSKLFAIREPQYFNEELPYGVTVKKGQSGPVLYSIKQKINTNVQEIVLLSFEPIWHYYIDKPLILLTILCFIPGIGCIIVIVRNTIKLIIGKIYDREIKFTIKCAIFLVIYIFIFSYTIYRPTTSPIIIDNSNEYPCSIEINNKTFTIEAISRTNKIVLMNGVNKIKVSKPNGDLIENYIFTTEKRSFLTESDTPLLLIFNVEGRNEYLYEKADYKYPAIKPKHWNEN
jgi:hypothetical protein